MREALISLWRFLDLVHWRHLVPSTADYKGWRRWFGRDVLAGVTVGIVALPLALAFAISSGASPAAGLVTAIVAGFVAAVFGGSHVQVSGPTGAMVVVLAPIAAQHGPGALPIVAIMAGVAVIAFGFLHFGKAVAFIPWPVIEGFTLGIAAIIFLQQVPTALGTSPGESENAFVAMLQSLPTITWPTVAWAILAAGVVVAIMLLLPRVAPKIPGSIVGILVVTLAAEFGGIPLARIGELPTSLPPPSIPEFNLLLLPELAPPAMAVAGLAAIESLLSARVAQGLTDRGRYDGDRELVGQGLASVASGFFGGIPATGAIARTAVNVRSGAHTRIAACVHALFLAGVVYLAAGLVSRIPLVALAGVLLATSLRMVEYRTIRNIVRSSRSDAGIFWLTALVTISFDLIVAVGIGILATAFFALRAMTRMSRVDRDPLPGTAADGDDRIALIRLHGAMYFGVGDRVLHALEDLEHTDVVILRMSQLQFLDSSGARALSEVVSVLRRRGIHVLVKGIQPRHLRLIEHTGVIQSLAKRDHLFTTLDEAIAAARAIVAEERARREAAA